jgi:Glycosyl transferase family 2
MEEESAPGSVAVVIPCFNDGRTLLEAVASAQSQDPPAEIIVVDDGSTDPPTLALMELLEADGVRVIHQVNQGPAPARMAGVRASATSSTSIAAGRPSIRGRSATRTTSPCARSTGARPSSRQAAGSFRAASRTGTSGCHSPNVAGRPSASRRSPRTTARRAVDAFPGRRGGTPSATPSCAPAIGASSSNGGPVAGSRPRRGCSRSRFLRSTPFRSAQRANGCSGVQPPTSPTETAGRRSWRDTARIAS